VLKRVEGVGDTPLFRGDPRLAPTDMDEWFGSLLTESYGAKARPWLYGADAGLCARRNVLLEHNEWIAGEKTATSNAYMSIGVALETMLAQGLHKAGRLVGTQVRLPIMAEVYVSGFIDIVCFDSQDELSLIEVKSCGKLPTEANPVHLAQIQFYAAASGLRRAWLTYISRDVRSEFGSRLAQRTFAVDCGEEALRSRLQVAATSRLAADAATLPPVPAHFRKHTECHYCEFRDAYCWNARPGLGGAAPMPPLAEYSPEEMIELERSSKYLSESMYSNMEVRYREFLEKLRDSNDNLQIKEKLETLRVKEWENIFFK
jgi:hypothetical protein